jgi:hypothetical protein
MPTASRSARQAVCRAKSIFSRSGGMDRKAKCAAEVISSSSKLFHFEENVAG